MECDEGKVFVALRVFKVDVIKYSIWFEQQSKGFVKMFFLDIVVGSIIELIKYNWNFI